MDICLTEFPSTLDKDFDFFYYESVLICNGINKHIKSLNLLPSQIIIFVNDFLEKRDNIFIKNWEWKREIGKWPSLILFNVSKKVSYDLKIKKYRVFDMEIIK